MERGEYQWRATITGIVAVKWMDKKAVHFISNYHNPLEVIEIQRKLKDGTKVQIPCPSLVKDYNKNMGFVDKADMLRAAYEIDRKSRKWYHRITFFGVDVSVVNAFIIFTNAASEEGSRTLTLKHFRLSAALGLIGLNKGTRSLAQKFSMKQVKSNFKPKVLPEIKYTEARHMPEVVGDGRNRRCAYCSTKRDVHRSIWQCSDCNVGLCLNSERNCFKLYHTQ